MLNISYPAAFATTLGIIGGSVIGLNISTDTERVIRGYKSEKISPFSQVPQAVSQKIILNAFFGLIIGLFWLALGLGIMRLYLGPYYCCSNGMEKTFWLSSLCGAALFKYLRYLYWRSKRA